MAVQIDVMKSARVAAVKAFATEHYEKDGWDIVVETMDEQAIFEIIKKARTPKTAIRAMANHIGARAEYRDEVIAMAGEGNRTTRRAKTSRQIRKALERAEGPQPDKSICSVCLTEVSSLEDLQNHDCKGILEGTVDPNVTVDLSSLQDKPSTFAEDVAASWKPELQKPVTDAEVDAAIEEIEINLTDYVEPTDEQKDEVNAEFLEDADAQNLNLDAPNGYFKNGNPKPVSKKDRERLGLPPVD